MAPAFRHHHRGVPRSETPGDEGPISLLFLTADTGGGHRAAANAVASALQERYPGKFAPMLVDPLGGPDSAWLLRAVTSLYAPAIRLAPWTWGAIYYTADSRAVMRALRATILRLGNRPTARAMANHGPAAVVAFHPLVAHAAVRARKRAQPSGANAQPAPPIITVVTDLITPHTAWRDDRVDALIVPSAAVRWRCHLDGISTERCHELGLPTGPAFRSGPLSSWGRAALREVLGCTTDRFLVVLTGGGEGSGNMARQVAALVRAFDDIEIVAICGRNTRLEHKLRRLSRKIGNRRLAVHGFVDNMADWLRVADVVVTKAGPGTIAEATCCGTPLLLTSHVPGQERGNIEHVVKAGAGRHVPTTGDLVDEIRRLRSDRTAVDTMRAASARLGRPHAATDIADFLATTFAGHRPTETDIVLEEDEVIQATAVPTLGAGS